MPAQINGPEIDLNAADARELSLLPGIGPVLATRIVDNRDRLGPFASVQDVGRVFGVGPKTLQELRELREVRVVARWNQDVALASETVRE